MNIDHLRYFLVLSQEMHYSRAAQRLNISQSGLSHAIAALEQELGSPCFKKAAEDCPGPVRRRPAPPSPADCSPG
ncbi:MAG: LysR family transcriptional regulator [Evtepia gabavorous]